MSFVNVNPRLRKSPWQGTALSVTYSGNNLTVRILMKQDVLEKLGLGRRDRVSCLRGEGEDLGKILIRPDGDDYTISNNGAAKTCFRIDVPIFEDIPQSICGVTPAAHEITDDGLLINIPKLVPKKKPAHPPILPAKGKKIPTICPLPPKPPKEKKPELRLPKNMTPEAVEYLKNNQEEEHPKAHKD